MAWGSFLGKIGTVAGVPGADIIGSGIDAYSDYERLRQDKAYRQFTMNEQVKRDQFMMENYVRDKAEQKAIRDDLIMKSANLASAVAQVNQHLGVPYAPSRADIIQDYLNLRSNYKGDVMRLAELSDSQKTAQLMDRLGGADSRTMSRDITQETLDEFAPQLQDADLKAKLDAMKIAESQMQLDEESRKRIQTHYAEPYQIGFDTMKDLLPGTPTYSDPGFLSDMAKASQSAMQKGSTAFSDSLAEIEGRIVNRFPEKFKKSGQLNDKTSFTQAMKNYGYNQSTIDEMWKKR